MNRISSKRTLTILRLLDINQQIENFREKNAFIRTSQMFSGGLFRLKKNYRT